MNIFSKLWLSAASFFEPVQYFFNGNFWKVFVKQFGNFEKKKVLDMACGTGEITKFINPVKYLGVDVNKFYIDYAIKRNDKKNTRFALKDITKLGYLETFDTALLISAAHHLSDKQVRSVLNSVRRNKVKRLIIVDAIPKGWAANILKWLDAILGGGKYFRSPEQLESLVVLGGKVLGKGLFNAKGSFYTYFFISIKL